MLTLPIKKKWFDMICSGEKTEEYRELTPYYEQRFKNLELLDEHGNPTNEEGYLILRNGYGNSRPEVTVCVKLRIRTGWPDWGAEEGKLYYVLEIKAKYVEMHDEQEVGEEHEETDL